MCRVLALFVDRGGDGGDVESQKSPRKRPVIQRRARGFSVDLQMNANMKYQNISACAMRLCGVSRLFRDPDSEQHGGSHAANGLKNADFLTAHLHPSAEFSSVACRPCPSHLVLAPPADVSQ